MSISTATINVFYASTEDPKKLVHTFFRKQKTWDAESKSQVLKGIPVMVITREPMEFVAKQNYVVVGGFHTSLTDTLALFPFKIFPVDSELDINQVSFIGRLGKDPDEKYSDSGSLTVHASLAHAEYLNGTDYSGKDGSQPTVWTKVSFLPKEGNNARGNAFVEFCKKQSVKPQFGISGTFHVEAYLDKETGEQRFSPKVLVNNLEFLSSGASKSRVEPADLSGIGKFAKGFALSSDDASSFDAEF